MQAITVAALAKHLKTEYRGDGACLISGIAPLDSAIAGQVSFLDNPKYKKYLPTTSASAVILTLQDLDKCQTNAIITDNPYFAYAKVAELFVGENEQTPGLHETVILGKDCEIATSANIGARCVLGNRVKIGEKVVIAPGCVIGDDCVIGDNSCLFANVTLYSNVHIGSRTIIHSGVVIGADGFGFAKTEEGWYKIPQLGGVRISDDVEIGANTTIDRGALGNTIIEQGVKLDNQIQIGHNVRIGAHTIVAGCAGIAGSATIGKRCMIGGGARIAGHIHVVDDTMITATAGISKSIKEPGIYCSGIQADKREKWVKNAIQFNHLGEIAERLRELEKYVLPHYQKQEAKEGE